MINGEILTEKSVTGTVNNENVTGTVNNAEYTVISTDVNTIMVVDRLPQVEINGVLYLVKEDIETNTNLYPSQEEKATSDGFTVTFKNENVIVNGSNDTKSVLGSTKQFAMNLEANKQYYLQFTEESGTMDDANRIAKSDGIVFSVWLTGYDSSGNATDIINGIERDANGIFEKYIFTPTQQYASYILQLQIKKYVTCSNWTLSVVVAEEEENLL
jgi:hypothetical protein